MARASYVEQLQTLTAQAKSEYKSRRAELLKQLADLDREYAFLGVTPESKGAGGRKRAGSSVPYGGVRQSVLDAIKSAKGGMKPAQIVEKTGLSSPQVHNALTGLKKSKEVKVKDGLYTA